MSQNVLYVNTALEARLTMADLSLTPPSLRKRQKHYRLLIGREVEMLDIFRQLPVADQEHVLLVVRGIAWAAGPIPATIKERLPRCL